MNISVNDLRAASTRWRPGPARTLSEARNLELRTAFLCHSHRDTELVKGLITKLGDTGLRIYVDWTDTEMPETPNRETASRIRQKIVELDFFLFLATPNSTSSRWCPWEIGYADGRKHIDQIVVIPTTDGEKNHGNEYLQLYRRLGVGESGRLAVWQPNDYKNGVLVSNL